MDQIGVEDFRDSEEDKHDNSFSDISEPEVGLSILVSMLMLAYKKVIVVTT